MSPKLRRLIEKLERHPAGPIELTQDECLVIGEMLHQSLERIELMKFALKAVETGIWRDTRINACGIKGLPAGVAHLVEAALGKRKLKT